MVVPNLTFSSSCWSHDPDVPGDHVSGCLLVAGVLDWLRLVVWCLQSLSLGCFVAPFTFAVHESVGIFLVDQDGLPDLPPQTTFPCLIYLKFEVGTSAWVMEHLVFDQRIIFIHILQCCTMLLASIVPYPMALTPIDVVAL